MGNNYDHARITAVDSLVCLKSNFDRPTFTLLHHLETTIYDTIVKGSSIHHIRYWSLSTIYFVAIQSAMNSDICKFICSVKTFVPTSSHLCLSCTPSTGLEALHIKETFLFIYRWYSLELYLLSNTNGSLRTSNRKFQLRFTSSTSPLASTRQTHTGISSDWPHIAKYKLSRLFVSAEQLWNVSTYLSVFPLW